MEGKLDAEVKSRTNQEGESDIPLNKVEEIMGTISSVYRSREGNYLTIKLDQTQKVRKVFIPESIFLPIKNGDAIRLSWSNDQLMGRPLVFPCKKKSIVHDLFVRMLLRAKLSFREASSEIRVLFANLERTGEDPVAFITSLADRYYLNGDPAEAQKLVDAIGNSAQPKLENYEGLLRYWGKDYHLRRLYLLGLYKKTIRQAVQLGYTLDSLYQALIDFPFRVFILSDKELDTVLQSHPIPYTAEERRFFNRLRDLHDIIKDRGWSAFPSTFSSGDKKILQEKFGCLFTTSRRNSGSLELGLLLYQAQNINLLTNLFGRLREEDRKNFLPDDHQPGLAIDRLTLNDRSLAGLDKDQEKIIREATWRKFMLIRGKAGTGKSTLIRSLVELYLENRLQPAVVSFTGKAVCRDRRILSGLNLPVMTIHRFLRAGKSAGIKVIIIDEASTISTNLLARLIREFYIADVRFILIGDPCQLQPIEYGSPFLALLESCPEATFTLTIDHRYNGKDGKLPMALEAILRGETYREQGKDYRLSIGHHEEGLKTIYDIIKLYHELKISDRDLTVIVPYNRLLEPINNHFIEIYLGKNQPSIVDEWKKRWYVGHRVMMTVNSYDIDVMNGEEGEILSFDHKARTLQVLFDEKVVEIPTYKPIKTEVDSFNDDDDEEKKELLSSNLLQDAWCLTIDKSQGSEWPYVIAYIPEHKPGFIHRYRLYTAYSRARKRLDIISDASLDILQKSSFILPPPRYHEVEYIPRPQDD